MKSAEYLRTRSTQGKIILLIIGAITMGSGLHSHFTSVWVQTGNITVPVGSDIDPVLEMKFYHICVILNRGPKDIACPDIAMERYFVSVVIVCFFLSLAGFIAGFVIDVRLPPMKYIDLGYHILAAVLLIIAGVLYIISADQSYKQWNEQTKENRNFKRHEKFVVGALTCVQGILYGVVAVILVKSKLGRAVVQN